MLNVLGRDTGNVLARRGVMSPSGSDFKLELALGEGGCGEGVWRRFLLVAISRPRFRRSGSWSKIIFRVAVHLSAAMLRFAS